MSRKILYSPSFGAGWTTWNQENSDVEKLMLTYQPIIDAIERGESITEAHLAVQQLVRECKERFGEEHVCVLACDELEVAEVAGPVRIDEYDGYESIHEPGNERYI